MKHQAQPKAAPTARTEMEANPRFLDGSSFSLLEIALVTYDMEPRWLRDGHIAYYHHCSGMTRIVTDYPKSVQICNTATVIEELAKVAGFRASPKVTLTDAGYACTMEGKTAIGATCSEAVLRAALARC